MSLGAALTGYRSFASAFPDGAIYYGIINETSGEWEVGLGTLSGAGTTLARTTVLASSNANALVNFGTGTKTVYAPEPAFAKTLDQGTFTASVTTGVRNPLQVLRGTGAGAAPPGRLAGELWWNDTDLSFWITRLSGAAHRLNASGGWGLTALTKLADFNAAVSQSLLWYYDGTTTGTRPSGVGATDSGVGMDIVQAGSSHALRLIMDGSPQAGGVLWLRQASAAGVWGAWTQVGAVQQDGSATAPSVSFVGAATTGLFRITTGGVGISVAGVEAARVVAAGTALSGATDVVTREKGDTRYARPGYGSGLADVIAHRSTAQTCTTVSTRADLETLDRNVGGAALTAGSITLPAGTWILRAEGALRRSSSGSTITGAVLLLRRGGVAIEGAGLRGRDLDACGWVTVESDVLTLAAAETFDVGIAAESPSAGDWSLNGMSLLSAPTKTVIFKAWRIA